MGEEKYIEHAQSSDADVRMTARQAKVQWDTWAADPEGTGMYLTGSKENNDLKFRIFKQTDVDFKASVSLSKKLKLVRDNATNGGNCR